MTWTTAETYRRAFLDALAERDRAREIAVALEQEVADLRERLEFATWGIVPRQPAPGEFCDEHFSWLCQAGQGRCSTP